MLQDDRHLDMHEQMRNKSGNICVHACFLTAEVMSSPADANLMCVADCHVRGQKVTLVILVVEVARPHDVAKLFWRHLQIHNQIRRTTRYDCFQSLFAPPTIKKQVTMFPILKADLAHLLNNDSLIKSMATEPNVLVLKLLKYSV